MRFDFNQASAA
jgi:uncharacterized protein YidB (DUF937 family)